MFCQGLAGATQEGAMWWRVRTPVSMSKVTNDLLQSNVFPFKVVFHVQTAMHAIAKYCSSVSKKKEKKKQFYG